MALYTVLQQKGTSELLYAPRQSRAAMVLHDSFHAQHGKLCYGWESTWKGVGWPSGLRGKSFIVLERPFFQRQ